MNTHKSLSCLFTLLLFGLLFSYSGCGENTGDQQAPVVRISQHSVTTDDNVDIALYRYVPSDGHTGASPILLCPGFSENHLAFDLNPASSMSRYLAGRGIETWSIDFRGRGSSGVPEGTTCWYGPWSIDDFGYLDITAAAEFISSRSPSGQIFLLGFSEGDAASTAYLLEADTGIVRGHISLAPAVVIGATLQEPDADWPPAQKLINGLHLLEPLIPKDLFIAFPKLVQTAYQLFVDLGLEDEILEMEFWNILWNMENMTKDRIRDTLFHVIGDISGNVFKQYLRGSGYIDRKGVCTFEGSALEREAGPFCYKDRLSEITVPTLVLAGIKDQAVPPVNARYVLDRIGSQDKSFLIFGTEYGYSFDYGHDDLTFGVHASQDVYPAVAAWVLERM